MISEVRLSGFKAFDDATFRVGPFTLLSGLNSSGKSSVLQALGLLRQTAENDGLAGHGLDLNGEYVKLGTGRDVHNERAESDTVSIKLTTVGGDALDATVTGEADANVLPWGADPPVVPEGLSRLLLDSGFQYLRADRITPAVVFDKSHLSAVVRRSLGGAGQFTGHFLAAFRDEPAQLETIRIDTQDGSAVTPGLLSQVTAWMREVSPGVRVEVEDIAGTDFVQLRFGFGRSGGLAGTQDYRATHVGFGLTYTLPIVVACVGSRRGDTLLIENPEAHVHPRGQMALGRLLALTAAGGVQVMVETHSDHVLNGLRLAVKQGHLPPSDARLLFFHRSESDQEVSVQTPELDAHAKLDVWPEGFFDQFDVALEALL